MCGSDVIVLPYVCEVHERTALRKIMLWLEGRIALRLVYSYWPRRCWNSEQAEGKSFFKKGLYEAEGYSHTSLVPVPRRLCPAVVHITDPY